MPLTSPTIADLETFRDERFDETQYERVLMFLQAATDLAELASDVHEDPLPNTIASRVIKMAILDMAWYIGTSLEDRDAEFSPFSSERIGSYSYNKAMKAARGAAAQPSMLSGVPFFDILLRYFSADDLTPWSSSESVMPTSVEGQFRAAWGNVYHDPSVYQP